MEALKTWGDYPVLGRCPTVSEGFEFVFLGSSAQLAYNGGARKRGFRSERTRENRSIPPEP